MTVQVPEPFAQLGFSGLFHAVTSFPDDETRNGYRAKAPCLLKDTGWMLLRVDDDGTGVLVRRDGHALLETLTRTSQ